MPAEDPWDEDRAYGDKAELPDSSESDEQIERQPPSQ